MQNNTNNINLSTNNTSNTPLAVLANAAESTTAVILRSESQNQQNESPPPSEDPLKIYSAAEVLKNYKEKENKEYSKMLYTMAIGLNSVEIREEKCEELIKDKVIKVSDVKPSLDLMKLEVDRRFQIIFNQENEQGVIVTERMKAPAPKYWLKNIFD